jgi:hypothetical protein
MTAAMNAPIENNACPIDAIDNATQAREILQWIESISWATSQALEKDHPTHARHLAALGQYLACDWANHFDCQAEQLTKKHGMAK